MSGGTLAPRLLASADRLDGFQCRSEEQTLWLRRHARQAHARGGTSRVLVVSEVGGSDVVAYYAWCMASITPEQAPPRLRKGARPLSPAGGPAGGPAGSAGGGP